MKYEIIKTDDYLLVVDESDIKGWYYDAYINKVKHSGGAEYGENSITKNIISHLPLNGSPILEGVDLLPPLEDDVANIANQLSKAYSVYQTAQDDIYPGIVIGYKAAKGKYKYTEEDMITFGIRVTSEAFSIVDGKGYVDMQKFDKILQSLSQPKMPIGFECVTIPMNIDEIREQGKGFLNANTNKIKTTTTPEGHREWIGTYIYE